MSGKQIDPNTDARVNNPETSGNKLQLTQTSEAGVYNISKTQVDFLVLQPLSIISRSAPLITN
jgi:hypothetical protein